MAAMTRGFGDLNTGDNKALRPHEVVEVVVWGKDYTQVRIVGGIAGYVNRWIDIETKKGVISIPKVALNYDAETDTMDDTVEDPYSKIKNPQREGKEYFFNCIVRDIEDEGPKRNAERPSRTERKSGLMDSIKSRAYTPCRVGRITPVVARMLGGLKSANKHKVNGKITECDVNDDEHGCDVFILYNKDQKPNSYQVMKGDPTPLTPEQAGYLRWKIDELYVPESLEQARREAENLSSKCPVDESTEDEEPDESNDALSSRRGGDRDRGRERTSTRDDRSAAAGRERPSRIDREARSERGSARGERTERPARGERRTRRGI